MKAFFWFLLFIPIAQAQTITVSATVNCGKATFYCVVEANDSAGAGSFTMDARKLTNPYNPSLTITMADFVGTSNGTFTISEDHSTGTYTGNGINVLPDSSKHPFTVTGNFQFMAYDVQHCSGRGCGGTLGWHYVLQPGSTITVKTQ